MRIKTKSARCMLHASVASLLLLQTACIGTTPPSQFYLLEPVSQNSEADWVQTDVKRTLSLAPVRIPHYLDRPKIVTATGKNTYQLNELHRWAEALDDNITRVLAQDLSVMVPAKVLLSNTPGASRAQFRLTVTILEFHVDQHGQAGLTAQWQISRGEALVKSEQNSYRVPASSDDYRLMVAALNECLNLLSRDMATVLKTLEPVQ